MSQTAVAKHLDTRGLLCPMPIVKLAGAIKEIQVGEVIEVLATDPGALADVPAWARRTGNEVVSQTTEKEVLKFYIRRRV